MTDHFKNYHNGNYKQQIPQQKRNYSEEYFTTANTDNENQLSDIGSSFRNISPSERDFLDFKKNFEEYRIKENGGQLPEFLKKKGFLKD